ncbi:MAG TPA: DUF3037 domain-containing protein [Xanthomonadaceae bacterium]|jgi:hypothetical protein
MNRSGYSYATIRYVHDAVSGEALNVGVALLAADGKKFQFRIPSTFLRVKGAFPDANLASIRESLNSIERSMEKYMQVRSGATLVEMFSSLLPEDEGSIRVSKPGVGLTTDLAKTADELLERFILRCDWFDHADIQESREARVRWSRIRSNEAVHASCNDNVWEDMTSTMAARI